MRKGRERKTERERRTDGGRERENDRKGERQRKTERERTTEGAGIEERQVLIYEKCTQIDGKEVLFAKWLQLCIWANKRT